MTERITDERLAELRELQDKRIKGRGGVPEVRDLAKALTELAEFRERAESTEAKLTEVRRLAEADKRCPCCSGYGHILAILDGEADEQ